MKYLYTRKIAIAIFAILTIHNSSFAQVIYSHFANPTGHVTTSRSPNFACGLLTISITCPTILSPISSVSLDEEDASEIHFPIIAAVSSATVTMDLNGTGAAGTWGGVKLKNSADLVSLVILPSIKIELLNTSNTVVGEQTYSNLLDLELLSDPDGAFLDAQSVSETYNKVRLQITNPLGVNLGQPYHLYFAYGNAPDDGPLPIKLASFSVNSTANCGAQVAWTSETEVNTDRYILQRSVAGSNAWADVTTQTAISNGSMQSYSFTDRGLGQGAYAYRLVSIDRNGAQSIHQVALYSSICNLQRAQLYPTITSDKLFVSLPTNSKNTALQIINMNGAQQKVSTEGSGNLRQISVKHLAKGNYLLRISSTEGVETLKFIVQ